MGRGMGNVRAGRGWSRAWTRGTVLVAALIALLLVPPSVYATTADGVLLTNLAWATFKTTAGAGTNITYGVTANVLVATPAVALRKTTSATLQAAGGYVTFCLSFSNASGLTSAVNVVVNDRIPANMGWADQFGVSFENDPPNGVIYPSWSSNNTAWTGGVPPLGQVNVLYLRWTVNVVGPKQSGYMCYTATIL